MGFSKQEYWNELPFPPPGDLPNSGIEQLISCVACIDRQILYQLRQLGSLETKLRHIKPIWGRTGKMI